MDWPWTDECSRDSNLSWSGDSIRLNQSSMPPQGSGEDRSVSSCSKTGRRSVTKKTDAKPDSADVLKEKFASIARVSKVILSLNFHSVIAIYYYYMKTEILMLNDCCRIGENDTRAAGGHSAAYRFTHNPSGPACCCCCQEQRCSRVGHQRSDQRCCENGTSLADGRQARAHGQVFPVALVGSRFHQQSLDEQIDGE